MFARRTYCACVVGLALGVVGLQLANQAPLKASGDFGFGPQVAGTYFGVPETVGGGPFFDTLTFSADGTYTGTNTDGDPTDGFSSPEHGVWKRVGRREIAATSLVYTFNEDGTLNFILRVRGGGSFSRDFNEYQGTFTIDIFLPDQDPLSDDPVAMDTGTFDFRRLHVME